MSNQRSLLLSSTADWPLESSVYKVDTVDDRAAHCHFTSSPTQPRDRKISDVTQVLLIRRHTYVCVCV